TWPKSKVRRRRKSKNQFRLSSLAALLCLSGCIGATAAPSEYFGIHVLDEATGRGVPLVELTTVNRISLWTDTAASIAFNEPGLMRQEVFFHVRSYGYEYPRDGFDNRGIKLKAEAGRTVEIKLKRLNIAERLYRITGAGIYRDSWLLGRKPPTKQPMLTG